MLNETLEATSLETKPEYVKPEMKIVSESELLAAFQVTQAAVTWWVM
jgi:hypothetical protein